MISPALFHSWSLVGSIDSYFGAVRSKRRDLKARTIPLVRGVCRWIDSPTSSVSDIMNLWRFRTVVWNLRTWKSLSGMCTCNILLTHALVLVSCSTCVTIGILHQLREFLIWGIPISAENPQVTKNHKRKFLRMYDITQSNRFEQDPRPDADAEKI